MADRVDIVFTEKGAMRVEKRIGKIADASYQADRALTTLSGTLAKMGKGNTALLNATSRLTNAQVRQSKASMQQELHASKLQLQQQKLNNAQLQAASISQRMTNSQVRQKTATNKLTKAQDTQNASLKRGISLRSAFNRLLVFAGVTLTADHIIRTADAYTLMTNKLRNVSDSLEQVSQLQKEVFEVANRSRTAIGATTQAFQRFDLALQQFGGSQKESLRLTETVNKLLATSGANVYEQRNALLQLSQAFNKGKLDGDEFRSVMELIPPVADAIASELNTTRGELLKLAPQGVITTQIMRKALGSVADEADRKFSKLNVTLGQAFTVLGNKSIEAIGNFEKATGFFSTLAKGIVTLANNLDLVVIALGTLGAVALTTATGLGVVTTAAGAAAGAFKALWVAITGPVGLTVLAIGTVGTAIYKLIRSFNNQEDAVDSNTDSLRKGNKQLERRVTLQQQLSDITNNTSLVNAFALEQASFENINKHIKQLQSNLLLYQEILADLPEDNRFRAGFLKNFDRDLSLLMLFGKELSRIDTRKQAAGMELLNEQFSEFEGNLQSEISTLQKLGIARESQNVFLEMQKKLYKSLGDNVDLFGMSLTVINAKLKALADSFVRKAAIMQELNSIYNKTKGETYDLVIQLEALNLAFKRNLISAEAYKSSIAGVKIQLAQLKNETGQGASWSSVMLGATGEVISGYSTMFAELEGMYASFFSNISNGLADLGTEFIMTGRTSGDAWKNFARGALQDVINQLIKIAIRAIIVRAITSSFGGGAGGVANVVTGFASGGYTGNAPRNDVAGVVHGREFVVNADATRRNRPMLEAMNAGRSVGNMSVNVTNTGTPQDYKVESMSPNEIRLIASDVVAREAPGVVADDMNNPNSKTSKSTMSNFKTGRRR
jgi:tape measure domain-containing protein